MKIQYFSKQVIHTLVVAALLEGSTHSFAADTAESAPRILEEIIVAARRVGEDIQKVPTAITALSAEELRNLKIDNFGDVGQTIPNLNVQTQFGSGSAPQFIMRGQSTGLLSFEADSRIGLYIDGVYMGRAVAAAFDVADHCQLEVLRGPQGTLFGRNSTGGAINLKTCAPAGEFSGAVDVGVGNYNDRRTKMSVNTPEWNGLTARFTYVHHKNDGYVDNSSAGHRYPFSAPFGTMKSAADFGAEDSDAYGLTISYRGIEALSLDYKFDHTDKKNTQLGVQLLGFTNSGTAGLFAASGGATPHLNRQDKLPLDFTGTGTLKVTGHALVAEYALTSSLSVKNIASYREFEENTGGNDIDGSTLNATIFGQPTTAFCYICSMNRRDQEQVSEELQLIGVGDKFEWILGAFYFKEEGKQNGPVFIGGLFPLGPLPVGNLSQFVPADYFAGSWTNVTNESKAVYGHVVYQLSDDWELAAGLRYTEDEREEFAYRLASFVNTKFNMKSDYTDWDTSLTWFAMDDVSFYAKVGTAHLSGGVLGGLPFDPEKIQSFELGMKSMLMEQRLRLNAAVFHSKVENLQTASFSPATGTIILNTGETKQDGIEIEFTALLSNNLEIKGSYGYIDVKSDTNMRPMTPKSTAYLGFDYKIFTFANGSKLSVRVDANWKDDAYGLACPAGSTTTINGCTNLNLAVPDLDRKVVIGSSTDLAARVVLGEIPLWDEALGELSVWGRNLLDNDELEFPRSLGNGTVVGTFQIPRVYGVDLSVRF